MSLIDPPLQEIHDFLIAIAHQAGTMILAATPSTGASGSKKNSADLVTETDQAVEKMVSTSLKTKYPDYKFMGEETYKPNTPLTPSPTFICDPIDGTTNFIHGFPYVSISLGFAMNLRPMVGIVYNPFTSTLYSAIRGQGSFMTHPSSSAISPSLQESFRRRLPLRQPAPPLGGLSEALIAVEWGSDRSGPNFLTKTKTFRNLAASNTPSADDPSSSGEPPGSMAHSLRSLGSAALNLCAVAAGSLDLYWEAGCWAWDVAAGWVILEEAGGMMVDANPGGWTPRVDGRSYLAVRAVAGDEQQKGAEGTAGGQGKSGREMVEEFWGVVDGRFEYAL
ncbi:MAG: hypothetical protein M1817_002707 [Caeruleum heppii]|nr:MAG: hypothetical protein M1817_002707 [Caeruleum heppii]